LRGFAPRLRVAFREVLAMMRDSVLKKLESDLKAHGDVGQILGQIEDPNWNCKEARHDWRNDIPHGIRDVWNKLSTRTKAVVYLMAVRSENWG
jgi:hypothetical protein